jgi:site-specific DNA-cytosine methylase
MARIIGEVRPRYAFVENSPMLTSRGLGTVLGDLAALGFDARWGVVSAADVGAPHLRERIWIVATNTGYQQPRQQKGGFRQERNESVGPATRDICANLSDADSDGCNFILQREGGRKGEAQCATVAPSNQRGSDNRQSLGNSRQIARNGDVVCGREATEISNSNSDSQSISAINAEQVCQSNLPDTDNGRRGRREVSGKGGDGRSELYGENEQVADTGYERVCQQGISNDVGEDDELPRGIQPDGLSVRGFKEGKDMADPNSAQCKGNEFSVGIIAKHADIGGVCGWSVEPNVGRVANGVAARVDRLKAIGNGQVPRVAATAFKLLAGEF